eukprot:8781370-Pyramimonas_sp.AAC.1
MGACPETTHLIHQCRCEPQRRPEVLNEHGASAGPRWWRSASTWPGPNTDRRGGAPKTGREP